MTTSVIEEVLVKKHSVTILVNQGELELTLPTVKDNIVGAIADAMSKCPEWTSMVVTVVRGDKPRVPTKTFTD